MSLPRVPWGPFRLVGWCLLTSTPALAQLVDPTQIGLTDLNARYGVNAPRGISVTVWQTEAPEANDPNRFLPDPSGLGSHNFIRVNSAGPNVFSSHATAVGGEFYGPSGVAPGVPSVWATEAGNFLGSYGLHVLGANPPAIPTVLVGGVAVPKPQVMNASWIVQQTGPLTINVPTDGGPTTSMTYTAAEANTEFNRRVDYLIQTSGLTAVVGIDNSPTTPSSGFVQAYNTIAVGLSNRSAAQGYSNTDGNGRMVVDIVAPASVSSFATPAVAGAAALLVDQANRTGSLSDARDPRVVRSLLMTGAQKPAGWEHGEPGTFDDVIHPLDKVLGAGELRINRSYDLLLAGEKTVGSVSLEQGWSLATIAAAGVQYYFVDTRFLHGALTATLNWNRTSDGTIDGRFLLGAQALADLNLQVFASDLGNSIGSSLALSASQVDNVEHVYLSDLPAGRYAIAVQGVGAATYALSFQVVPEMAATAPVLGLAGVVAGWMWKRFRGRQTGNCSQ